MFCKNNSILHTESKYIEGKNILLDNNLLSPEFYPLRQKNTFLHFNENIYYF